MRVANFRMGFIVNYVTKCNRSQIGGMVSAINWIVHLHLTAFICSPPIVSGKGLSTVDTFISSFTWHE